MNKRIALAAFLVAAAAPLAAAADDTAGISGYVIDSLTNKPLPGAAVVIARLPVLAGSEDASVIADRKGFFARLGLPAGTYAITANVEGRTATCLIDDVYGGITRSVRIYLSAGSDEVKCVHARVGRALVDPDESADVYVVH
jgi:Carboxypeptidase regulatory-like domain